MKKISVLSLLFVSFFVVACGGKDVAVTDTKKEAKPTQLVVKSSAKNLSKNEKHVYDQLAEFAKNHIHNSNKNIIPNKRKPKIEKQNNIYVASYVEFDVDSLSLELIPTPHRSYKYLAKVKYREKLFQSKAADLSSALKGEFKVVGSRFITEVPRYNKGKWTY